MQRSRASQGYGRSHAAPETAGAADSLIYQRLAMATAIGNVRLKLPASFRPSCCPLPPSPSRALFRRSSPWGWSWSPALAARRRVARLLEAASLSRLLRSGGRECAVPDPGRPGPGTGGHGVWGGRLESGGPRSVHRLVGGAAAAGIAADHQPAAVSHSALGAGAASGLPCVGAGRCSDSPAIGRAAMGIRCGWSRPLWRRIALRARPTKPPAGCGWGKPPGEPARIGIAR